uniref:Uncharacterized protein n=1 Tax=Anguilla anguilla TaxID=7936 RepID=A0A0E9TC45_ANGAN
MEAIVPLQMPRNVDQSWISCRTQATQRQFRRRNQGQQLQPGAFA